MWRRLTKVADSPSQGPIAQPHLDSTIVTFMAAFPHRCHNTHSRQQRGPTTALAVYNTLLYCYCTHHKRPGHRCSIQASMTCAEECSPNDIAIIGLSCRFAGDAKDIHGYWDLLRQGKSTTARPNTKIFAEIGLMTTH